MKEQFLGVLLLFIASLLGISTLAQSGKTPEEVAKVHGHLFQKGPAGQIPDMLSRTKGDIHVPCVVGIVQRVQMSLKDEQTVLAAESDLVVLAKAVAGMTHMNADEDFLYTDWSFTVEEVLKDNHNAPVQSGATILVTRPGGKLQVNGRTVYANCADFQNFADEQEYLLYLRFVPETGAYSIGGGSRAFAVSPTPKRLDPVNFHESEARDGDALLKSAREGVAISHTLPHSGAPQ